MNFAVRERRRRSSHKFETRISAIADFARKGKREKKALPLSPVTDRRRENPGALENSFSDVPAHYEERTVRITANSFSTSASVFHRCGVTRIACPRTETCTLAAASRAGSSDGIPPLKRSPR